MVNLPFTPGRLYAGREIKRQRIMLHNLIQNGEAVSTMQNDDSVFLAFAYNKFNNIMAIRRGNAVHYMTVC